MMPPLLMMMMTTTLPTAPNLPQTCSKNPIPLDPVFHTSMTCYIAAPATKWLQDVYAPAFQAIECLVVAVADLSIIISAISSCKPTTQTPHMSKMPNLHM